MEGMFPEYDEPEKKNVKKAWAEGIFVFDSNVLLNLYRYQHETRNQLLKVLQNLSNRIWIPHHVALEFQRNRVNVIEEQEKRFAEVYEKVTKTRKQLAEDINRLQLAKRHALIDPNDFIENISATVDRFLEHLNERKEEQQTPTGKDSLKETIESLFKGKVGEPPESQEQVDKAYDEAESRYRKKIPPGFMDESKEDDNPAVVISGGIQYLRKYGDYMLWRQILEFVSGDNIDHVIFVTDDNKEDWWWKGNSNKNNKIGPRPELIDEMRNTARVRTFLMYNPERFLEYAEHYLNYEVSSDVLEDVRDVSNLRKAGKEASENFKRAMVNYSRNMDHGMSSHLSESESYFGGSSEESHVLVWRWLEEVSSRVIDAGGVPIDFIVEHEGRNVACKVFSRLEDNEKLMRSGARELALINHGCDEVWFIVITPSREDIPRALRLEAIRMSTSDFDVRVIPGWVTTDALGENHRFCPYV